MRALIPGPTRRIDPQDHVAKDKEITIQMITRDEYTKSQGVKGHGGRDLPESITCRKKNDECD